MNIKSLLLGSAAAGFAAVSGAQAADPIVYAEPEPLEYVRICDIYGTGFYYIPGTETCLRVGGYLRYDIGVGSLGLQDVYDKEDALDGVAGIDLNDTYYKRARAAIILDARSETELGTLRAYIHINHNYDTTVVRTIDTDGDGVLDAGGYTTAGDALNINHAYIELGGLRIGKTDSLFGTFTGYAGGVINDSLVPFAPFGTHQIAYTFTGGNGFTAAVALEEGAGSGLDPILGVAAPDTYAIDSYMPHVVGGVGFTQGWGGVRVVAGYDSVWEEWAAKARLDFTLNDRFSAFVMGGLKDDDDGELNYYGQWAGDWAVWGGFSAVVSPKATVNTQLSFDDGDNFAAVANVAYELVPGLTITPEVAYTENFDVDDDGDFGGFLRFQRDF